VDKELLKNGEDIVKIIAVSRIGDVRNCGSKLFHIYPPIREGWPTIEAKTQ
jgi:hypothetical protein